MELWELAAREQIRDVLARYAQFADGGRFAELVALFTASGVMEIDGRGALCGRDAILDFLSNTKSSIAATHERPYIRHHVNSIVIDVTAPTQAISSSYFLAITQSGPDHWGRYRDDLVQVEGVWRFAKRRVRVDGHASTSWRALRTTTP